MNESNDFQNYKRVAEVWMDEYAKYVYARRPNYGSVDPGDLSKQRELRERLKCKSFKWFMEEVAFDIEKKYPLRKLPDYGWGKVGKCKFTIDYSDNTRNYENNLQISLFIPDQDESRQSFVFNC